MSRNSFSRGLKRKKKACVQTPTRKYSAQYQDNRSYLEGQLDSQMKAKKLIQQAAPDFARHA